MADARCEIVPSRNGGIQAVFATPQWAPTPGQYLVLYDGDVCLGGGVIESAGDNTGTGHSEDSALLAEEPAVCDD
jgi:hypothetical protein